MADVGRRCRCRGGGGCFFDLYGNLPRVRGYCRYLLYHTGTIVQKLEIRENAQKSCSSGQTGRLSGNEFTIRHGKIILEPVQSMTPD